MKPFLRIMSLFVALMATPAFLFATKEAKAADPNDPWDQAVILITNGDCEDPVELPRENETDTFAPFKSTCPTYTAGGDRYGNYSLTLHWENDGSAVRKMDVEITSGTTKVMSYTVTPFNPNTLFAIFTDTHSAEDFSFIMNMADWAGDMGSEGRHAISATEFDLTSPGANLFATGPFKNKKRLSSKCDYIVNFPPPQFDEFGNIIGPPIAPMLVEATNRNVYMFWR